MKKKLFGLILSSNLITGSNTTLPTRLRIQLKENGPSACPPLLCATKAVPQINAVRTNRSEFLICLLFICIPSSYLVYCQIVTLFL